MIIKSPKGLRKSILDEFRAERGQSSEVSKPTTAPPSRKRRQATPYDSFLRKYNNLENSIDDLGTRDLVYYFREVATEQGYKYVISNIKKDMAVMKRARENYSNRELCGMIEFLYMSEQDYLDKSRLSPNLLVSGWVNTIYADMKLWVEDKYIPKSALRRHESREWDKQDDSDDSNVTIGVKL